MWVGWVIGPCVGWEMLWFVPSMQYILGNMLTPLIDGTLAGHWRDTIDQTSNRATSNAKVRLNKRGETSGDHQGPTHAPPPRNPPTRTTDTTHRTPPPHVPNSRITPQPEQTTKQHRNTKASPLHQPSITITPFLSTVCCSIFAFQTLRGGPRQRGVQPAGHGC